MLRNNQKNSDSVRRGVFFAHTIAASDLVRRISHQIDELKEHCMHYMFGDNLYDTCINSTQNQLQNKLATYLQGSFYQKTVEAFSVLGVKHLRTPSEMPSDECVNICVEKDEMGLPLRLTINLPTGLHGHSFDCDLSNFQQEKERMITFNLTYIKQINLVSQEIDSISGKLPEATDAVRLQLLNDFNEKWAGQLTISYVIDLSLRTGEVIVTDASGTVISINTSNHIKIDSTHSIASSQETLIGKRTAQEESTKEPIQRVRRKI